MAARLQKRWQRKYQNGFQYTEHGPHDVGLPLRWRKPRRIFVNSMSDLFHEDATTEFVGRCFDVMMRATQHTYQILTKRPRRMAEFAEHFYRYYGHEVPGHIWMGTSVENTEVAHRIDELRRVRCAVRFVSFEPLLGAPEVDLSGAHWAIVGGESGPGYRPVRAEWVRGLIAACGRQDVPVFFKQWGGVRPGSGGRLLDGRTYDGYPECMGGVRQTHVI